MRNLNLGFILCSALMACSPHLREGDLLFHVSSGSNPITEVTSGMIDHVAIVLLRDSVIEAVDRGVVVTPVDSLRAQQGYYILGNVKGADRKQSVANARTFLGRAYDHLFLPDNDDIYCSELVQLAYVDKNGNRLFEPIPMSFHDSTGVVTPYWQEFYARHGLPVPEGAPGTNPSELSRRAAVRMKAHL